ncbi:MAG: sugar kinase [Microcystaceae cyanobacterium]
MRGLFVGLTTLDCLYLAPHFPLQNEKIVALEQLITVGGPATNAAITFSHLGQQAVLLSGIGNHVLSQIIHQELKDYGVKSWDLAPDFLESPAISSIIVTAETGDRAIISRNATGFQASLETLSPSLLNNIDVVLIDGHQMAISAAIAVWGRAKSVPVVIDGGSWKKGFEKVLPYVDYAICSANFLPPNCHNPEQVFHYLQKFNIPHIAITQGENSILYSEQNQRGEILVKPIKSVDTLGAGDIFHGAFCQAILANNFIQALEKAAEIASFSCQYFGPRQWMENFDTIGPNVREEF